MKVVYHNRYKDKITFEHVGKIVEMTGHSPYYRIGYPNVYDKAYQAYLEDNAKHLTPLMNLKDFEKEVHNYSSNTAMRPYVELVYSDENTIDMVDPSGGPYLVVGSNLRMFFGKDYEDLIIKTIKTETGKVIFEIK
jgi:hypothetical protein